MGTKLQVQSVPPSTFPENGQEGHEGNLLCSPQIANLRTHIRVGGGGEEVLNIRITQKTRSSVIKTTSYIAKNKRWSRDVTKASFRS